MSKRRSSNGSWAMVLSAGTAPPAWAAYEINLPPPATTIAQQIYDLHNLVNLVCLGIFLAVFVPMFYAIWRHRKSRGHSAQPFREHLLLEISWTVAAFLLLVVMAIPTTKLVMAMKDTGESAMSIKVTGRQWKWEYDHQPQGHRHAVPAVLVHHADDRRRAGAVIRAELFQPGLQLVNPELFNQLTTMHG
jgi:heme/copper-type cytochrome/quinol oxidase subunit 2